MEKRIRSDDSDESEELRSDKRRNTRKKDTDGVSIGSPSSEGIGRGRGKGRGRGRKSDGGEGSRRTAERRGRERVVSTRDKVIFFFVIELFSFCTCCKQA